MPGLSASRSSRRCVRDAPHGEVAGETRAAPDRFRRGERLLRQGRREPAIAAFPKAVEIDSESARARYGLGLAWQERYDHRGAFDEFRRAVASDGKLVAVRNALGTLLGNTGDPAAAVTEFCQTLEVQPEDLRLA